jgi:hypothetical protein
MYERFPGGADPVGPSPVLATMPRSVQRAVRAMYVGAAASLIGIAVDLTALSAIRRAITKRSTTMTAAQVNTAVHVEVGFLIAGGLIGAALWLWMAQSCKSGKGWARTVSTVLFGIDTLSLLASLAVVGGGLTRIYGLVVWVIGLIAIILLWQRPSSDYFRGAQPPGPAPSGPDPVRWPPS